MVNIGSTSTGGRVMSVKGDLAKVLLTSPACTEIGEKVALSRRIDKHWRLVGVLSRRVRARYTILNDTATLIGWGSVRRGTVLEVEQ